MNKRGAMLLFALLMFSLCGCGVDTSVKNGQESSDIGQEKLPELTVSIPDTGKSDCILIETQGHAIMIDTSWEKTGDDIVAILKDRRIETLDYLILTHLDKDHIGGAAAVLGQVGVTKLIQSCNDEKSDEYAAYRKAAQSKGIEPVKLREPLEVSWQGSVLRLLPARLCSYEEDNDYSILIELTYGGKRFLFAGDAEGERLAEYLQGDVKPFDMVKMPHHGRACDMTQDFTECVRPSYAVITCTGKNPADTETLEALERCDAKVYQTSGGRIEARTDGEKLTVRQYGS